MYNNSIFIKKGRSKNEKIVFYIKFTIRKSYYKLKAGSSY